MPRSGLFAKPIITEILAYLKLLDNYHESQAVYRILTSPIFAGKIKNSELAKINYFANKKNWSLYEVMEKASLVPEISPTVIEQFNILLSWINKHTELAKTESVSKVIYGFLEDTGYLKILSQQSENGGESVFWLNQFFKKVESFETISFDKSAGNFIKMVDIMISTGDTGSIEADLEEGPESVKVMTVHSAKGLEFKYVFIVNLVDRRFPTIERQEAIELPDGLVKEIVPKGDVHLQEERRLFYVAITRTKQELYLTSADDYGGKFAKKLSRFLYEVGLEKQIESKQTKPTKNETAKKSTINKTKKEITPPTEFSFSQLISYNTCPWQYYYAYILRIPVRGHFTLSFGKSIHNTLNRFCSLWLEKNAVEQAGLFGASGEKTNLQNLSLNDLLKIYQEMWIDDWYESKDHRDKYKDKGHQLLKGFYDDFVKNLPEIKYLEKEFKFKLGDYTIKGTIDRVDKIGDYYEIIDYKTGEGGENKLDKEKKQQLLIYQLAAKFLPEVFDKQIQQLTFYYLETGERISFLGDDGELAETQEKIIKTIKEINKGDFNPKPSRKCEWCDFKKICDYRQ
jgi:DNA helicase-2/ATP-dependent DNA helicase PcrA